jgi:hypothetical protein
MTHPLAICFHSSSVVTTSAQMVAQSHTQGVMAGQVSPAEGDGAQAQVLALAPTLDDPRFHISAFFITEPSHLAEGNSK